MRRYVLKRGDPDPGSGMKMRDRQRQGVERTLRMSVAAESPSTAALRRIEEALVDDLRPVRPLASARRLFTVFAAVLVGAVALRVYTTGTSGLEVMTSLQSGTILISLAIGAGLLAWSLVQQMTPASRRRISPELLLAGIVVSLAVLVAVLFRFQHERHFWERGWWCIRAGASTGLLAAVPTWLVLRRGAMLSPRLTGVTAGFLAGLAGTVMLEIHCPDLRAGHILVAHLGVAVYYAMAGFVGGSAAEAIGKRRMGTSRQLRSQ